MQNITSFNNDAKNDFNIASRNEIEIKSDFKNRNKQLHNTECIRFRILEWFINLKLLQS